MADTKEEDVVDLYAGLALPPPKKRSAHQANALEGGSASSSVTVAKAADASAESTSKRQRTSEATASDVASVVARLKTHMLVDKKFPKACSLFQSLMVDKLDAETRTVFLDALTEMVNVKAATWSGKPQFAELIKLLLTKQDLYTEDERVPFKDWSLLAVTHRELFTDDSFEFARATKQIRQRLDAAVAAREPKELTLLMPLLRTLFSRHSTAWAKPSVESVLGICTRHRLLFSDSEREEVDKWTSTIQERRHASTTTHNAASDARRNIVELDDSNASQAKPKVGRSNHPLFNRNE